VGCDTGRKTEGSIDVIDINVVNIGADCLKGCIAHTGLIASAIGQEIAVFLYLRHDLVQNESVCRKVIVLPHSSVSLLITAFLICITFKTLYHFNCMIVI
jgi:hypothetical protein